MSTSQITEMICILDKSGSMYGKESDTIGSFNQMLKEQKDQPGEAYITTALFSDCCRVLYRHIPVQKAEELTEATYFPGGNTALFDAIGEVINEADQVISGTGNNSQPKILVFIITDGMENASRHYDLHTIRKLIQEKQSNGWEFLFFGTDMETLELAQSTGIKKKNTLQYTRDSKGIKTGYQTAGQLFTQMRRRTE